MQYPVLTPSQLALHLRSLRKARNLTQSALGAELGINQARVGKIERDPGNVSVRQLMQLLAALGVRLVLEEQPARNGHQTAKSAPW